MWGKTSSTVSLIGKTYWSHSKREEGANCVPDSCSGMESWQVHGWESRTVRPVAWWSSITPLHLRCLRLSPPAQIHLGKAQAQWTKNHPSPLDTHPHTPYKHPSLSGLEHRSSQPESSTTPAWRAQSSVSNQQSRDRLQNWSEKARQGARRVSN